MAWVPWEDSPYRLALVSEDPDVSVAAGSRIAYAASGDTPLAIAGGYALRPVNDPFPGKQLQFRVTVESYTAANTEDCSGLAYAPAKFIVFGAADFTDGAAVALQRNTAAPYPATTMPDEDAVDAFAPSAVVINTPAGYYAYRAGRVGDAPAVTADTAYSHLVEVWLEDDDATYYDPARAWPFALGGEVAERWEWSTNGLRSPTGMEQTIKLRRSPRVFSSFDGLQSGRGRRLLESALSAGAAGAWHVPLPTDACALDAPATSGALRLSMDTTGTRFAAGGRALIVDRDRPWVHQMLEVDAVDAAGIDLAAALAQDWPAGSRVVPTRSGFLPAAPALERFTGDAVTYSVEMQVREPVDVAADFGSVTYRELPVLEWPADWSEAPTHAHARNRDTVDYGMAPPVLYDESGVPLPRLTLPLTVTSRAELATLRSLLYAMAGRWKPVWVPSLSHDVRVVALASSTQVDIEAMGYPAAPQVNRRDLRIEKRDGSILYRRVTAATDVDAATQRITLDAALPSGFAAADVARVSFMALCRQDSDVNVLRLWQSGVVVTELGFEACAHEF